MIRRVRRLEVASSFHRFRYAETGSQIELRHRHRHVYAFLGTDLRQVTRNIGQKFVKGYGRGGRNCLLSPSSLLTHATATQHASNMGIGDLTVQQKQEIKEAFELFDTDGSGKHTLPLQLHSPRRGCMDGWGDSH